jgi:thiamine pyrophosphate-dependent acetolactate synthase large subunit-like protein
VIRCLLEEGVNLVYGYPGGDHNASLWWII